MAAKQPPEWMLRSEERRSISRERAGFLRGAAAALRAALTKARREPERGRGRWGFSAPTKLALATVVVALVAASRNFAFAEIVGCALLALLASMEARKMVRVLSVPIQAFFLSLLILAPSLFWDQTRALIVIPFKTLVSTTALSLLIHSTNWNRFTCAFKTFGVPDAIVFIFDLTLKYIAVLSEICLETLDAVLLRSVGRNRAKARSLGGVVGVMFLRSQKASREQFDAMTCRCFSGVYRRYRIPLRFSDALGALACALLIALFIYLELAIRCSN